MIKKSRDPAVLGNIDGFKFKKFQNFVFIIKTLSK